MEDVFGRESEDEALTEMPGLVPMPIDAHVPDTEFYGQDSPEPSPGGNKTRDQSDLETLIEETQADIPP